MKYRLGRYWTVFGARYWRQKDGARHWQYSFDGTSWQNSGIAPRSEIVSCMLEITLLDGIVLEGGA